MVLGHPGGPMSPPGAWREGAGQREGKVQAGVCEELGGWGQEPLDAGKRPEQIPLNLQKGHHPAHPSC